MGDKEAWLPLSCGRGLSWVEPGQTRPVIDHLADVGSSLMNTASPQQGREQVMHTCVHVQMLIKDVSMTEHMHHGHCMCHTSLVQQAQQSLAIFVSTC